MGYSASKAAFDTLERIQALCKQAGCDASNSLPDTSFWEIGKEQEDGSITGSVHSPWKPNPKLYVRSGSFRIEADGRIARFPRLPSAMKLAAGAPANQRAQVNADWNAWMAQR